MKERVSGISSRPSAQSPRSGPDLWKKLAFQRATVAIVIMIAGNVKMVVVKWSSERVRRDVELECLREDRCVDE